MAPTVTLRVKPWLVKHLTDPGDTEGGFQNFHKSLIEKVESSSQEDGSFSVEFTDEELGHLVRLMGYGSGGFQGRLRKTFTAAVLKHIGYD